MIKLIKLVTGEDIIANIEEDEDTIIVSNPAMVMVTPQGVGLIPYPMLPIKQSMNRVDIRKSHIVFMVDAHDDLINGYNERFGSGLVVADTTVLSKLDQANAAR